MVAEVRAEHVRRKKDKKKLGSTINTFFILKWALCEHVGLKMLKQW
jgi:hypothetical protein